ncbi:MAG TPA: hypothetical protein VEK79_20485 [Thermoanaerobaculia bacterium]|nr:hypothetical protein [Thermoanaerobaculia bacterium]
MIAKSLRTLLDGLIDYAGLFPPAALSMQDAVRNYARYREQPYAWALGRFVVPAERAHEVPSDFPLSVLWSAAAAAAAFESGGRGRRTPYEVKAANVDDVERIATDADGRTVYVEITDLTLLDAIARHGLRAKIRTGGLTPDALPPVGNVAEFLRACKAAGVAFKATAGLHHPLRCVKPLTYEADAPTGTMHGFLNVFLAAAMLEHGDDILREEDARAFAFDDEAAWWHGHRVTTDELRIMRRDFATSFGSCSFEEPISDLRALGWIE